MQLVPASAWASPPAWLLGVWGSSTRRVWGFAAGVLNLIPYIGSAVVTGAAALVAFMQFGEIEMAVAVAGASLAIHTVDGQPARALADQQGQPA